MAAKLTRLTHKITIQLHLVAESCTNCSTRSRRPVRKLLDTLSDGLEKHYVVRYFQNSKLILMTFIFVGREITTWQLCETTPSLLFNEPFVVCISDQAADEII
jgi:hypothetical protein